jgi:hypothetical protein
MAYVITCGDEGVQINEGTRIGVLGAGVELAGFDKVVSHLKKTFGKDLRIATSEENEWVKQKLDLSSWDQVSAMMQQHVQVLADKLGLLYAGVLPFTDPQELEHDVRGHMVRPKGVHIANKISFTLGGGEQTYHLGHYVISADWVAKADKKLVESFLNEQIAFYNKMAKMELPFVFEMNGELGEATAEANKKMLESVGIKES